MNYPLISEYIEAIKLAGDNFEELSYLRPVLGDDGLPVMTSGNFAVVFKMKDEQRGKFYALKCFTKEQEGREEAYIEIAKELENVSSPYLVSIRYLEKELFVDTDKTTDTEFPVLQMDWVEGKTLDEYLRENLNDKYALEMLAYRFSQLAQWLIPQPFAHGDLKPDNILVREDDTLVLVDYDGMYVPAMKGQKARELGSPDFRHPQRTEDDFDEHIDDFPIISILLSLKSISIKPQLLQEYGTSDRLLFSKEDYLDFGSNKLFGELMKLKDDDYNDIIISFIKVYKDILFMDDNLSISVKEPNIGLYTKVTEDDLINSWEDDFGAIYSKDGRKLLKGADVPFYEIRKGTIIICDKAFSETHKQEDDNPFLESPISWDGMRIERIKMPDSVKYVGYESFADCECLKEIHFSNSLSYIGISAFSHCKSLRKVSLPDSVKIIDCCVFEHCFSLKYVELPSSLIVIGYRSFRYCQNLNSVICPQTLSYIGDRAFEKCTRLADFHIPSSVETIGNMAFNGCSDLNLVIPPTLRKINGRLGCKYSISADSPYLHFEDGVLYNIEMKAIYSFECKYDYKRGKIAGTKPQWAIIGHGKREEYYVDEYDHDWVSYTDIDVLDIYLPDTIETIGDYAFSCVPFIRSVMIPESVKYIGLGAFENCERLQRIHLPECLCTSDIIETLEGTADIIIPNRCEESLDYHGNAKILVDYEDYIHSCLDGFLFSREEVCEMIKQEYGFLNYVDYHCATSVFCRVIQTIDNIMQNIKQRNYEYSDKICILLGTQKEKVEYALKSIIKGAEK